MSDPILEEDQQEEVISPEELLKANKAMNRAKVAIMRLPNSTFISSIIFSLKQQWTKSVESKKVDGIDLLLNPDYFMGLNEKQRISAIIHAGWHVAFMHVTRMGGHDLEKWNKAADMTINNMMDNLGYELPPEELDNINHDWDDKSAEQIYKLLELPPQPPQPQGGGGSGDGNQGPNPHGDIQAPPKDPGKKQEIEAKITQDIIKARDRSKMSNDAPGTIPGEIEMQLDAYINPKLPWNTILQNFMSSFQKEDYSWRRPNRRYMPDHYLPSLYSEGLGEICVAVDTSGSVTDEQFTMFLSEINEIRERLKPSKTTIIDFDTSIKHVHELGRDDSLEDVTFSGRGGTMLEPVFDYYDKTKPEVLIVFSDLYCRQIEEDPGYPVIWVCVDNQRAEVNFGELIHFSTDD